MNQIPIFNNDEIFANLVLYIKIIQNHRLYY